MGCNMKFDIEKEFGFIVFVVCLAIVITCSTVTFRLFHKKEKLFAEDARKAEATEVTSDVEF